MEKRKGFQEKEFTFIFFYNISFSCFQRWKHIFFFSECYLEHIDYFLLTLSFWVASPFCDSLYKFLMLEFYSLLSGLNNA